MSVMPGPSEATRRRFRDALPEDERVLTRPMFGQVTGFVNGNMFAGTLGEAIFVRLEEAERAELIQRHGATPFTSPAGRTMKEYVVLPDAWSAEPVRLREWVGRALATTAARPARQPKPARPGAPRRATG